MSVTRLIDANANRAREALRTLEDAARFVADDAALAGEAKAVRHAVTAATAPLLGAAASQRDTPGDVGTALSTEAESDRPSLHGVIVAAAGRLGESLRCLEEFAKLHDPASGAAIEALRYRGYELDRRLRLRFPARRRPQWRLCLLLTEALCRRPWREVLTAAVAAGADCVQVREKQMDGGALLSRVREAVALAGGADVVVNDRLDLALAGGAAGVHLGQGDLPAEAARRAAGHAGARLLIGVSTSRLDEARAAAAAGADYCGVGPMFPTTTKHKDHIVGPAYLRDYTAWGGLPHLAIGGVTADRVPELAGAGARGLAVSAAVCGADDPGAAVTALLAGLSGGLSGEASAIP